MNAEAMWQELLAAWAEIRELRAEKKLATGRIYVLEKREQLRRVRAMQKKTAK